MKVGIYDPYLDDLGGGEKYMGEIAACLSKDNDVTFFWDRVEDVDELKKRFALDLLNVKVSGNIFRKDFGFLKRLKESKKYDLLIVLSDGSIPFVSSKLFVHIQQPFSNFKLDTKTKFKVKRVKKFFCNSNFTKTYTDKAFGVRSEVLYPPVELKSKDIEKENIILTVGKFRFKGK